MKTLKLFTILLPTVLIGGFEYVRHDFLLDRLSMETGNLYIALLTLILSYCFATWMFRRIEAMNERLIREQARRAVYEERERLAQELHDNIAQILFFLNVQLKKGQLEEARSAVSEIDHHLRQAIFNLRTAPEAGANFVSRLQAWLEEWSSLSGIAVDARISLRADAVAPSAEVALFSIIREAFTNIRKHSAAARAGIELGAAGDGDHWLLVVRDDGVGMDAAAPPPGSRHGLAIMRKLAGELRAELQVQSTPGEGFTLTVRGKRAAQAEEGRSE